MLLSNKYRCLFLLKSKHGYSENLNNSTTGLSNSVRSLMDSFKDNFLDYIESKVAVCIDSNYIDKEVFNYKPDVCFLEAIWVTPEKMIELVKLHPNVKFIIRVHSRIPFLSNEGNALTILKGFESIKNVFISLNNRDTHMEMQAGNIDNIYLPNIYENKNNIGLLNVIYNKLFEKTHTKDFVNIGCFGAIRPMKNQLLQALAAIIYGNKYNKTIYFHVNAGRTEQNGNNVLKNLRALFEGTNHKLVEHGWMEYEEFIEVVKKMDIGLQVSLSESFNIVTADFVINSIPIIVSEDIKWMPNSLKVSNFDAFAIAEMIDRVINRKVTYSDSAKKKLKEYNINAINEWKYFFNNFKNL